MISWELTQREREGRPIRVSMSGAGWMGTGFLAAVRHVPGMVVNVIADEDVAAARASFLAPGRQTDRRASARPAMDALRAGRVVATGSTGSPHGEAVDIVTDVTWSPATGAEPPAPPSSTAGRGTCHIEADVTVGRILRRKAEQAGVLYSVSGGDEPAA